MSTPTSEEIHSEATDAIREILKNVQVNRTRANQRLVPTEIERIIAAIGPVVLSLEIKEEAAPAPKWYGITVAPAGSPNPPVITTDKKADVLVEFIRQNDLEEIADIIQGTSVKDADGKRVYYFYSVPTKAGPITLYVVHSDYLDRLPSVVLAAMEESEEEEPEETEDESEK